MEKQDLDALNGAYSPDFKYHDENLLTLGWCAERMSATIRSLGCGSLLSLGIGHRVASRSLLGLLGDPLREYTIVEGSADAVRDLLALGPLPAGARVVNALFEEFEPGGPLDAIEMGFILEHVDDPLQVVRRYAGFLGPQGRMFVAVPNARALHRLVGQRAGLLKDLHALSEHDRQLGHQRYFDLTSLRALLEAAGLRLLRSEGVFLKCLTTSQLQSLALPPRVLRAFCEVAVDYPELANAIYVEAGA